MNKQQKTQHALETVLAAIRYRAAALAGGSEQQVDYANARFWQSVDEAEALMEKYRNETNSSR